MILIWIHERGIYTKIAILSRKITINYWILECPFFLTNPNLELVGS